MAEGKSVMEKIVCHSEPITKGFEFRWTIDQRPGILTLSQPLQSPVFKALQWNWTIGTQYRKELHQYQRRGSIYFHYLDISVNLVDSEGNKIQEIPNHPFFNSTDITANVSILDKEGKYLMQKYVLGRWYMKTFGELLNTGILGTVAHCCNFIDSTDFAKKSIVLLLEVRVVCGSSTNILTKTPVSRVTNTSTSMRKLLDEGKFTDFVIRTGDGDEIRAHRNILNNSSKYFEAMFELGGVEVEKGEIKVPESHAVMNALVRFLYTGEPPKDIGGGDGSVEELFVAADKYQITKLKAHLESVVDSRFSVENTCGVLAWAASRGDQCLKAKAAEFIHFHRKAVVNTEGWRQLVRERPDLVAFLL